MRRGQWVLLDVCRRNGESTHRRTCSSAALFGRETSCSDLLFSAFKVCSVVLAVNSKCSPPKPQKHTICG